MTSKSFAAGFRVNLAPEVDSLGDLQRFEDPRAKELTYNPRFQAMYAPVQGPQPLFEPEDDQRIKNCPTGYVEETNLNSFIFDQQYHNFHNRGYAIDPSASLRNQDQSINYVGQFQQPTQTRPKRKAKGDPGTESYLGPWAPFQEDKPPTKLTPEQIKEVAANKPPSKRKKRRSQRDEEGEEGEEGEAGEGNAETLEEADEAEAENGSEDRENDEDANNEEFLAKEGQEGEQPERQTLVVDKIRRTEEEEEQEEEEGEEEEGESEENKHGQEETSTFHGDSMVDYQGRSFLTPPSHLKSMPHQCYLPKKLIHTWKGHTKAVNCARLFPTYGQFVLSASMDCTVKLWDVYGQRTVQRTYMGHTKGVRDVCYDHNGHRFLSCSYDRYIKLWDTETGQCIRRFTNRRVPYTVKFHPDPSMQNEFLAGCSDKKIIQWDARSGKITQKYDQHLGAVNTITFVDSGRRFVTSSDDKSIRVWEYGIPVVIKYISEPHMHSMPSIQVHPTEPWMVAQSLDNQILVYSTKDRFRVNKKKRFMGHLIAGFACQVNFSPDGRFVMSGDSDGTLWIWDWKSSRVYKKMKCHDKVLIGCEWHPIDPSRVVTCSWDGTIKYWD